MPGQVKTRLAEFLGGARACECYRLLLRHTLGTFAAEFSGRIVVSSATADRQGLLEQIAFEAAGRALPVREQRGSDLGARMAAAFQDALADEPARKVLLAGTDIPQYTPRVARITVDLLDSHDAVLGPAHDGGYYLIALRSDVILQTSLLREIFAGIAWSTPDVYATQLARLGDLGLRVGTAPRLRDIDTFDQLLRVCEDIKLAEPVGAELKSQSDSDSRALARLRRDLAVLIPDIRVILPILNEAENLNYVLRPIFATGYFREVICADNGSTDGSRELAERLGARVTLCMERGYGATCLKALADIRARGGCDVIVFMDGDGADDPAYIAGIVAPVAADRCDLSLGARVPELALPGALFPHARLGNWLITRLVRLLWKFDYRDLGPFRAMRWESFERLAMDDRNYGWTVQMQIRALRQGMRVREVPVPYRKRNAGQSKVTASLRGSYLAGKIILRTLWREWRRG